MITTIAAIDEKKFSDRSDDMETTLQGWQRSQRLYSDNDRWDRLQFYLSDRGDRSDHMKSHSPAITQRVSATSN